MSIKKSIIFIPIVLLILFLGFRLLGTQGIETISTNELAKKLQRDLGGKEVVFIDVSEPNEYETGHINGMINIPLSTLQSDVPEFSKDTELVLICRSGNRSMQAANILKEVGYSNITNVDGGIQSWQGEVVY